LPNEKVILFGSQARGDVREDSDWDLLVLLNKGKRNFIEDYDKYGYPFSEIGDKYGTYISAKIYTKKDWESHPSLLKYNNVAYRNFKRKVTLSLSKPDMSTVRLNPILMNWNIGGWIVVRTKESRKCTDMSDWLWLLTIYAESDKSYRRRVGSSPRFGEQPDKNVKWNRLMKREGKGIPRGVIETDFFIAF